MKVKRAVYGIKVFVAIIALVVLFLLIKQGEFVSQPRPNLGAGDFPAHSIDVSKYFTPQETMWDPKVQISKADYSFFLKRHGDTYTPFDAYMSLYDAEQIKAFGDEVVERNEGWFNSDLAADLEQCSRDSWKYVQDLRNEICAGEQIYSETQERRLREYRERIENGVPLPGDKEELAELERNQDAKYYFCSLPVHIDHELGILEENGSYRCEQDTRSKIDQ